MGWSSSESSSAERIGEQIGPHCEKSLSSNEKVEADIGDGVRHMEGEDEAGRMGGEDGVMVITGEREEVEEVGEGEDTDFLDIMGKLVQCIDWVFWCRARGVDREVCKVVSVEQGIEQDELSRGDQHRA